MHDQTPQSGHLKQLVATRLETNPHKLVICFGTFPMWGSLTLGLQKTHILQLCLWFLSYVHSSVTRDGQKKDLVFRFFILYINKYDG